MNNAKRQTLTAFRGDPFYASIRVYGVDLSAAVSIKFAVRLYPDAPGEPVVEIGKVSDVNASGIRIVAAGSEAGTPYTDLEILIGKGELYPAAPEPGGDLTLAYDFEWTEAPNTTGFYNPERTIMFGDFIVRGSVNG